MLLLLVSTCFAVTLTARHPHLLSSASLWPGGVQLCLLPHLCTILPSSFPLWKHVDWQLHFKDLLPLSHSWLSYVVGSWREGVRRERGGELVSGSRIVLWGQFRWLALKCKLKRASLCSFKVTRARQCNVKLSLPCLCCVRCGDWQKLLVIV